MTTESQIIIGVPGQWPTYSDVITEVATKSNGMLLTGRILMDAASKDWYEVDIQEHDARLPRAFEIAGGASFSNEDLQQIQSHTYTIYAIAQGGSLEAARKMLDVGQSLLQAGGLAVKVETTGKAHTSRNWMALAMDKRELALYEAFVTLIGGNGSYHSCGMHNLGLRDAIVQADISADQAAKLLQSFLLYVLSEQPEMGEGNTFSMASDAPYYRLHMEACTTYPEEHTFFNPFGMWKILPYNKQASL